MVDQLSRRGYRFAAARSIAGSAVYDEAVRRVYGEAMPSRASGGRVIAVDRAAPVLAGILERPDENEIRVQWRERAPHSVASRGGGTGRP